MTEAAIVVNDVFKSFGTHPVLKSLSFTVPEKSVYGFLGNNGVGKSTTVRLLLGLLRADSGTIEVLRSAVPQQKQQVLGDIGSIIDFPSLYSNLTGREYLKIGKTLKKLSNRDVDQAISLVGMQKNIDRRLSNYSLGMKQRIALANALMGMPKLLILDEPTNGLDPSGMKEIRTLLKALPDEFGSTVFLSSHLLDEVEKTATHIGLVQEGTMALEGELSHFLKGREGCLKIVCEPVPAAKTCLTAKGFTVSSVDEREIVIEDIDPAAAPKVHECLMTAGVAIYESHFEKTSLEQMFLRSTERGEKS